MGVAVIVEFRRARGSQVQNHKASLDRIQQDSVTHIHNHPEKQHWNYSSG